jgi:hypothetical protein
MASTTPAFTVAQSQLAPSNVLITDTTVGPDPTIVSRRVFIQTTFGTYLTPIGTTTDYIQWSYANPTILLDILPTDYAVSVTVQWLNVSNVIVDTLTQVYCLREWNKQFLVYLGQLQAVTPGILQDANYAMNLGVFWAYVQYAFSMVDVGADIASSQNLLDKASYMRQNQSLYF